MARSGLLARRVAQDGLVGRSSSATPSGGPERATKGRVWSLFGGVAHLGRYLTAPILAHEGKLYPQTDGSLRNNAFKVSIVD